MARLQTCGSPCVVVYKLAFNILAQASAVCDILLYG